MSRNSSGNYTLPAGNPVVTLTTITSAWANSTLADLATEITNSLDRSGRGAMLAPLAIVNGSAGSPGLTFPTETNTGLYRSAAGDIRFDVGATNVQQWLATGVVFPVGAVFSQTVVNGAGLSATGNGTGAGVSGTGGASGGAGLWGIGGATSGAGVVGTGGATNGVGVAGNGVGNGVGVLGTGGTGANVSGVEGVGTGASGTGVTGRGAGSGEGGEFFGGPLAGGNGVEGNAGAGGGDGGVFLGALTGNGVTGTGGATGAGLWGIGGATSGAGVVALGTAGNASGVVGTGQGSGGGVRGTGGTASGNGVTGTGGAPDGIGVSGQGAGNGTGGVFRNVAGSTAAALEGRSASAAAGAFLNNTSTGVALQVHTGHASFTGGNPTTTTGFSNTLTPRNIIKAWARFTVNGIGGITVADGFNITSIVITSGTIVTVTFATAMGNTAYGVDTGISLEGSSDNPIALLVFARNTATMTLTAIRASGGAVVNFDWNNDAGGFTFSVLGIQ